MRSPFLTNLPINLPTNVFAALKGWKYNKERHNRLRKIPFLSLTQDERSDLILSTVFIRGGKEWEYLKYSRIATMVIELFEDRIQELFDHPDGRDPDGVL